MQRKSSKKGFWQSLGPGLTTGGSDDDPSGIATYSQAGGQFGLGTLWTAFLTIPLMINIFELTGRISLATSKTLTANFLDNFPKWLTYGVIFLCFPAIIFNVGANLAAMAGVSQLIFPNIPFMAYSSIYALSLALLMYFLTYKQILKWLKYSTLILLVYVIVPFLENPNWKEVAVATFIPQIKWDRDYFKVLVAIIGTTISPYLFFWESISTVETQKYEKKSLSPSKQIDVMRFDVIVGMIFSNIIMYFIILSAASTLYKNGETEILSVEQAARSLEPLAGEYAYILFTIGVIGAALVSIPVLTTQLGYMLCRLCHKPVGMDKNLKQAKLFYGTILGAFALGWVTNLLHLNPIGMLIYTSLIYGCICPILQAMLLYLGNKRSVMGKWRNGVLANIFGTLSLFLMSGSTMILCYFWLF